MTYSSLRFRIVSNSCLRPFHAYIYYKHQLVNYSISPKKGEKMSTSHLTLKQRLVLKHIANRNVNIICLNVLSCLNHQKRKKIQLLLKYCRAHTILVSHFLSVIFFFVGNNYIGISEADGSNFECYSAFPFL